MVYCEVSTLFFILLLLYHFIWLPGLIREKFRILVGCVIHINKGSLPHDVRSELLCDSSSSKAGFEKKKTKTHLNRPEDIEMSPRNLSHRSLI